MTNDAKLEEDVAGICVHRTTPLSAVLHGHGVTSSSAGSNRELQQAFFFIIRNPTAILLAFVALPYNTQHSEPAWTIFQADFLANGEENANAVQCAYGKTSTRSLQRHHFRCAYRFVRLVVLIPNDQTRWR